MSRTKKGSKGPGWEPWSNLREKQEQKADYVEDDTPSDMNNIQRALDKQAKLEETADITSRLEFVGHIILQAKLARAVIEASMAVNDTDEQDFSAHDSAYLIGEAKMSKLHFALKAWADHVNGEGT